MIDLRGTAYDVRYQGAIQKDITDLINFFPNLKPFTYQQQFGYLVYLQGTIPIDAYQTEIQLPIQIIIPKDFPQCSPSVKIILQQNLASFIKQSSAVDGNGNVKLSQIHRWVFKQSTLQKLLQDLVNYFTRNPPVIQAACPYLGAPVQQTAYQQQGYNQYQQTYQQQGYNYQNVYQPTGFSQNPTQAIESIKQQAFIEQQKRIQDINMQIAQKEELVKFYSLEENQIAFAQRYNDQLQQSLIAQQQSQQTGINDYPVDPVLEQSAKRQAKIETFQQTVDALRDSFTSQSIPPEQFFDNIRKLAENHFKNVVFDDLSRRSQVTN